MVIETIVEGKPRKKVFCALAEIEEVGVNTYSFVNLSENAIGDSSEVIVIDSPGMLLFYNKEDNLLHSWS